MASLILYRFAGRSTAAAESSILATGSRRICRRGTRLMGWVSFCGFRRAWRMARSLTTRRWSFPLIRVLMLMPRDTCSITTSTLASMSTRSTWMCSMVRVFYSLFLFCFVFLALCSMLNHVLVLPHCIWPLSYIKKKKKTLLSLTFIMNQLQWVHFSSFFGKKKLIKNLVCSKLSMLCLIYTVMNLWCSYSVFFFSCSVVVDWISGCFEFVGGKGGGSYLQLLGWKRVSFCSAFFFFFFCWLIFNQGIELIVIR